MSAQSIDYYAANTLEESIKIQNFLFNRGLTWYSHDTVFRHQINSKKEFIPTWYVHPDNDLAFGYQSVQPSVFTHPSVSIFQNVTYRVFNYFGKSKTLGVPK